MTLNSTFPIFDRLPPAIDIRAAVQADLLLPQASIAPRYFYDAMGCVLYEAITHLPEYYPTQTEIAILREATPALAQALGIGRQLIDLGSGDSVKAAKLLLPLQCSAYVAVDIARSAIESALPKLAKIAPQVSLSGVVTDFAGTLDLSGALNETPRLFFYPGSSIGNFDPLAAEQFLQRVRAQCRSGKDALLIGVDSVKETARLKLAYDDPLGVTAAFNLNVLRHLNAIADTDFDVAQWQHIGFFNEHASRIEMHLQARQSLDVRVGTQVRHFASGERIHTENSYKYTRESFEQLLDRAGFATVNYFTDTRTDFHVFFAQAR
jgi:dimethylhistidine N-methyltransferase